MSQANAFLFILKGISSYLELFESTFVSFRWILCQIILFFYQFSQVGFIDTHAGV